MSILENYLFVTIIHEILIDEVLGIGYVFICWCMSAIGFSPLNIFNDELHFFLLLEKSWKVGKTTNCLYIKYIPPTFTASALPLALKEDGAGACAVGVEVAVTKE